MPIEKQPTIVSILSAMPTTAPTIEAGGAVARIARLVMLVDRLRRPLPVRRLCARNLRP